MAIKLTKTLRNLLKAAIAANPQWDGYRAGMVERRGGAPFHTGTMTKEELLAVAEQFGIDVAALAAQAALNGDADDDETQAPAPEAAPVEDICADLQGFEGRDVDALIAEAIGPVSAFLAPSILEQLRNGVAPIAQAATQGPRVIVKERRIVVGEGEALPADLLPAPQVVRNVKARDYFGLGANIGGAAWARVFNQTTLPVYDYADAPAIDQFYDWPADMAAAFAACCADNANLWLAGPAGTGKSEGARQFAALGKRPFVRIAINRTTEPADLVGQYLPKQGGGFTWKDGPLTRAFRIPGCVILIDEPSFLRPGSLAVFQTVLDFGAIYLPNGETVARSPGVFIVAADNTAGSGDDSGRYADTAAMSLALIDRFSAMVSCDYLPEAREAALLRDRSGVPLPVAKHMVQFAALTRKGSADGRLTAGLTFRRLHAWARMVMRGVPSKNAFTMSVITPADPADRETLRQLETTQGGHDRIDGACTPGGSWEQQAQGAGQTATTQGARAAAMFDGVTNPNI